MFGLVDPDVADLADGLLVSGDDWPADNVWIVRCDHYVVAVRDRDDPRASVESEVGIIFALRKGCRAEAVFHSISGRDVGRTACVKGAFGRNFDRIAWNVFRNVGSAAVWQFEGLLAGIGERLAGVDPSGEFILERIAFTAAFTVQVDHQTDEEDEETKECELGDVERPDYVSVVHFTFLSVFCG